MRSTWSPRSGRSSSLSEAVAATKAAKSRNAPPMETNLAMAPDIRLPRGLYVVRDEVVAELASHRVAHVQRIPEVDAAPDAHLLMLFPHLREVVEMALQSRVSCVSYVKALGRGSVDGLENASRRTRIDPRL